MTLEQLLIPVISSLFSQDGNGTIENEELRGFLKDLLELVKKDYDATDLKVKSFIDGAADCFDNKKDATILPSANCSLVTKFLQPPILK